MKWNLTSHPMRGPVSALGNYSLAVSVLLDTTVDTFEFTPEAFVGGPPHMITDE